MTKSNWKLEAAARDAALTKGEEIAHAFPFDNPPVDPFAVAQAEAGLIHIEGDDFRDCFDGRISFHGRRFLLAYNTRYNVWPKRGPHHPKVRFTVAHELGHFYLDRHREFLVKCGRAMESQTEFESNKDIERQADAFAAGLLMPKYLLAPRINRDEAPTVESVKAASSEFDVSLTSMLVRWTQLSHFPCAAICVRNQQIQWGFVSEGFVRGGLWRTSRGATLSSADAKRFCAEHVSLTTFVEASGKGYGHNWLEGEGERVPVVEHYLAIPYSQSVMVFLTGDDADVPDRYSEEDQDY